MNTDISIVVPVYNGARTLVSLFDAVQQVTASLDVGGEIIFVDDGSTDDSWSVISRLCEAHGERARGVRLEHNFGQQRATYAGLIEARGRWIVTIDDDLHPHPSQIALLWRRARASNADLVYGITSAPTQPAIRRAGRRIFRALLHAVAPTQIAESSFRLIRSELVRRLPSAGDGPFFVDPLLARAASRVDSVAVASEPNASHRSRYTVASLIRLGFARLINDGRSRS